MAFSFLSNQAKKRDQIVAIDLGSRNTKAVHVKRNGDALSLTSYALVDAPVYDKNLTPQALGEHLKTVVDALGSRAKHVCIVLGPNDSVLRNAELPQILVSDMRLMLKHNTKAYLQQDLPDHLFDCHILQAVEASQSDAGKNAAKFKVLVGGAKRQYVTDLQAAGKSAGLVVDYVTTGLVAPANAFELAMPEIFAKEVVALVDFGFKHSSISILLSGELILSRVVSFGSAKLTSGIAESLGVSQSEAEGIKVGMPQEIEATIQPLLTPLGRELRASIDFFEHQHDKTVSQVFFSGGASRNELIVNALQSELMVPCKSWNPTSFLTLALSPQQVGEVEQVAPQLTVAIGGAVATM